MGTDVRNITSEVEAVLDEYVRPFLAAHGGDLKVAGVEGGVVFFHLTGRCAGCAAADKTSEELINRELTTRVPGVFERTGTSNCGIFVSCSNAGKQFYQEKRTGVVLKNKIYIKKTH